MVQSPKIARTLKFNALPDLLAEARRIGADAGARSRGRWTPAQNIWHVGRVIRASVEGFPAKPPVIFKLLGPLIKNRFVRRTFNPGITLPANFVEHFEADPDIGLPEALAMLESSIQARQDKGYIPASPLFGRLSEARWEQLHCRHAEMHFGMIELPGEPA